MNSLKEKIKILKNGGVGVLMTDTIYGLVGSALSKKTVERIYKIKGRDKSKPLIILISDIADLEKFGIYLDQSLYTLVAKFWPSKVSIILPISRTSDVRKFKYLHKGKKSLAFRLPAKKSLLKVLRQTGPLVAPSANPQGLTPAISVAEAKKYFGDKIDFYIDSGVARRIRPSKLIKIVGDYIVTLR